MLPGTEAASWLRGGTAGATASRSTAATDVALFAALALMWGSRFVAVKAGLSHVPPLLFAALGFDVATALLLAYAAAGGRRMRPRGRAEWADVAAGGLLVIGASQALYFVGQQFTTSATAAVVFSSVPILVAGLSRLALPSDPLTGLGALGLLVGFLGVGIVVGPSPTGVRADGRFGTLLVLASAACFAAGSVLTSLVGTDVRLALEARQVWTMGVGAAVLHAASAAVGESPTTVAWTPVGVLLLVYTGAVPGAASYLVYFDLLERLGTVEVSLVTYVVPLVAVLLGWLLLGERVAGWTAGGFLLVFVGFALVKRTDLRALLGRLRRRGDPG